MKFEYDLVVIGSTDEAIYAARKALELKARVALVRHDSAGDDRLLELISRRAYLMFISSSVQSREYPFCREDNPEIWLQNSKIWIEEVIKNLSEWKSLAVLNSLGIDVIEGRGEFFRLPELGMVAEGRKLKARSYLLATGTIENKVESEVLARGKYIKYHDFWCQDLSTLPKNILIIGNGAKSLEIAQILHGLGKKVFLVTEQKNLLPWEEEELVNLLQINLEAEGMTICTGVKIDEIKTLDNKKIVCLDDETITIDEIIKIDRPHPNIEGLNLEGVKIEYNSHGVAVDRHLKTSNSRIYVAGDILGGYNNDRLGRYEVDIALKNALKSFNLFPQKTNYNHLPIVVSTEPKLARVGMTEMQARKYCGDSIQLIRQDLPKSLKETIEDRSPTFCKLILRDNGEILGAHLLGDRAAESIESIAFAIEHKIKFSKEMLDR